MKRIATIAAILLLVAAGCKKEDSRQTVEFNVSEVVAMIGKSPDYVLANFKNATLEQDGASSIRFGVLTKDADYSVTFKVAGDAVKSAVIYGSLGNSDGLAVYRKESDKVNSSRAFVTYIARYSGMDFSSRDEFWAHLGQKGANPSFTETWWIENTASVKFTVKGEFHGSTNAIEFDIDRNEW